MTDRDSVEHDERDERVVAGAALFNGGRALAARGVWRSERRSPEDHGGSGDDRERLLRGLAATAATAHRAADGDRSAATERAADAVTALASVSDPRGVALAPLREWAEGFAADPGGGGPAEWPDVRIDGDAPRLDGLSLPAARLAAPALARAGEPGDEETIAAAAEFARAERGTGRTRFAELLSAYLRTPDARPQVAARLGDRVDREARKRRDVDDLF